MCRLLGFLGGVAFEVGIYSTASANNWQLDPNFMTFIFVCGTANLVLIAEIIVCQCCLGVVGTDILYRYKVLGLLDCLASQSQMTTTVEVRTYTDGTKTESESNDGWCTIICDIIMGAITSILSPILVVLVLLSMLNFFFCNCCQQSKDAILTESNYVDS